MSGRYCRSDDDSIARTPSSPVSQTTPALQVVDDGGQMVLWGHDLDTHHRLHQFRFALAQGFPYRRLCSGFESDDRGIDVVLRAIDQKDPDTDDREAGQDARGHAASDAALYTINKVRAQDTIGTGAHEGMAVVVRNGLQHELDPRKFAATATLFHVRVVSLGTPRDALAISHVRRGNSHFQMMKTPDRVDDLIKLLFVDNVQDNARLRAAGGLIDCETELRVIRCERG